LLGSSRGLAEELKRKIITKKGRKEKEREEKAGPAKGARKYQYTTKEKKKQTGRFTKKKVQGRGQESLETEKQKPERPASPNKKG